MKKQFSPLKQQWLQAVRDANCLFMQRMRIAYPPAVEEPLPTSQPRTHKQ